MRVGWLATTLADLAKCKVARGTDTRERAKGKDARKRAKEKDARNIEKGVGGGHVGG